MSQGERIFDGRPEHVAPPPKMAVFIDGPYLSKTTESLGLRNRNMDYDWGKMLSWLKGKCNLVGAYLFTGLSFSASAQGFFRKIESLGYTVVQSRDNPVTDKVAPVDHQLLTDLCLLADSYQIATVVSGDGDFAYAIERLARDLGKKVNIVAARNNTSMALTALTKKYSGQIRIFYLDDIHPSFVMRRIFNQATRR